MPPLINAVWHNKLLVAVVVMALVLFAMRWVPEAWVEKGWEDKLRYAGGILQLLGVYTVLVGISEKRKLFQLQSILREQASFMKSIGYALGLRSPRTASLTETLPAMTSSIFGGPGITKPRPGDSDQERIRLLEQNQDALSVNITGLHTRIGNEARALSTSIGTERTERDPQVSQLDLKVQKALIGGINVDIAGVLWLLVGIVLATYPQEIAKLWS